MGGFNGSGVYQRFYNWVNDAAASIKIRADRFDTECDGFAQGLSTCITKDGQTTITANLPMSTYKHTGVGAATSRTDYARLDQVQDGKTNWVDSGGTADAITAAYSIPLTTLVDGQLCHVRAGAANATTTPTFSPNGITARTIVKEGGSVLVAGDIAGDGHELVLRYDLTNTRWELLNPAQPTVSTEFSDSTFRIQDNSDATKEIAFEASGITTGTTRTLTVPDEDGEIALVANVATAAQGALADSALQPNSVQATKVTQSAGQSISNSTLTALAFDTESYDIGGWHDNSTNNSRITVDYTGYARIWGRVGYTAASNGRYAIILYKNGSEIDRIDLQQGAVSAQVIGYSNFISVASSDYLELYVFQTTGATRTTTSAFFAVEKVL